MSDKLEQVMKKIHIYLANCKESAYSSEELIVSKKRIFSLLEELNYAVYDVMEEYEVTTAARERGIAKAERVATDIKDEAMHRADDIHASSLLYTQNAITDLKNTIEYMHEKVRMEYEIMMMDYQERMQHLEQDSMEIISQLQTKADAKIYLRMIEEIKSKKKVQTEELEKTSKAAARKVGSAVSADTYAFPTDEYEDKQASSIVVSVHDTPRLPEGFSKKKKKGKSVAGGEAAITNQDLDAEYFAFQEEQQRAMEAQAADEEWEEEENAVESIFGAFKKFGFGNKRR